jgi:hypothetical protein
MTRRIWELHADRLGGAIRSTPEGDADIDGLILSEKAYLLAVRDFRPHQLVEMVRREGAPAAAQRLIAHYEGSDSLQGRRLVATRGSAPTPIVRRNDEVAE